MKKIYLFTVYCLLFVAFSCRPNLKHPNPTSGDADFSKFVSIGGNFFAGYQDGALYYTGQQYSIPYLIAKYMHLAGGSSEFAQPFMPNDDNGLGLNPNSWKTIVMVYNDTAEYQAASDLRYGVDCKGVSSLKPIKNYFSASSASMYLQHTSDYNFQNLSVPFAKIADYTDASSGISGSANPYYARFASNQGVSSMLSDAKAQQPTFFALWTGMEDIYDYARNGGYNQTILSSSSFALYLDTICSLAPQGVIANIPAFTSFPFYTLVPWNGLDVDKGKADSLNMTYFGDSTFQGVNAFHSGKNGFMIEDPASTDPPMGYRKMKAGEYILLTIPLDSMKCFKLGSFNPLPDRYVLDSSEVSVINKAIGDYNMVISAKTQQYNLALVDMNAYFKSVVEGIKWNGADFNSTFVSGGFFSLDGYHPNQKGYALIANEFVKTINSKYNSTIPTVNCPECSGIKFP